MILSISVAEDWEFLCELSEEVFVNGERTT